MKGWGDTSALIAAAEGRHAATCCCSYCRTRDGSPRAKESTTTSGRTIPDGMPSGRPPERASASVPVAPKMNKLETAWSERLAVEQRIGLVREWRFEAVSLKLADGCHYRPDFLVITKDGSVRFDETKGFMREAARVRLRVAASLYPWWTFFLVKRVRGVWQQTQVRA